MAITGIFSVEFTAGDSRTGPLSLSVPGVKAGDMIIRFYDPIGGDVALFESGVPFISVNDQIQQQQSGNDGNMSGHSITGLLFRNG